jgi:hypothetical protein
VYCARFDYVSSLMFLFVTAGKTVAKLTVTNEPDFRAITIRFTDKTAMHFAINARIALEPELMDWKTGDGESIKIYPVVHERKE